MSQQRLRVCSYNVLAQVYVRPVDKRLGTVQAFAAFEWCAASDLAWAKRRVLLVERLRRLCESCDVVALQEVQFAEDGTLPEWLALPGWSAVVPNDRDLTRVADRNERVLGTRTAVANVTLVRGDLLRWSVALGTTSLLAGVGEDWVVANVHLDAGSEQKRVETVFRAVAEMRGKRQRLLVVCGDLNSELHRGSPLGALFSGDDVEDEAIAAEYDTAKAVSFEGDLDAWRALVFATKAAGSACRERWRRVDTGATRAAYDHGDEKKMACWRLDHVTFDASRCAVAAKEPTLEEANPGDALRLGLPNAVEPSDHYPVVATLLRTEESSSSAIDEDSLRKALIALADEEAAERRVDSPPPLASGGPRRKPTPEEQAAIRQSRQLLKEARARAAQRRLDFVRTHLAHRDARDWFELQLLLSQDGEKGQQSSPSALPFELVLQGSGGGARKKSNSKRSPCDAFLASLTDEWAAAT